MKASGNGVTGSAGNVFIFKKEKDQRVTFGLESSLESLAMHFLRQTEGLREADTEPTRLVSGNAQKSLRPLGQWLDVCRSTALLGPGPSTDEGLKSHVCRAPHA